MNRNLGLCDSELCNTCQRTAAHCICEIPDFIRTSHPPTFTAYKSLYEEISKVDLTTSFQAQESLIEKAKEDFFRIENIREKYFSDLENYELRVLEIGPGLGHLGRLILEEGYDYFTTDIVPSYVSAFQARCFLANVELLPKFKEKFHIIIACDVFEHVLNEGDAILSVSEALRKQGALYIRSPYLETSINYATKLGAVYPFIHLRTYTKKLLRNLVESSGMNVKKLKLGKVVMVSHTRRDLVFRKLNFLKLRSDLRGAYHSEETEIDSLHGLGKFKKFEGRYRANEVIALNSIGKQDIASRVRRRIFFRPAEIWCIAFKVED